MNHILNITKLVNKANIFNKLVFLFVIRFDFNIITGCCGFIGSNICEFLLRKKYKVIGIDNLLTGKIENIGNIIKNQNFKFIEHDICDPIDINLNIDKILHFASTASPKDYLQYQSKHYKLVERNRKYS